MGELQTEPFQFTFNGFLSAAQLRELQERDLSREDVVAVVLDGKTFAAATMVIALGITLAGDHAGWGSRWLGITLAGDHAGWGSRWLGRNAFWASWRRTRRTSGC